MARADLPLSGLTQGGQRVLEDGEAAIDLLVGQGQGGEQANHCAMGAIDEQLLFHAGLNDRRAFDRQLDADHHAARAKFGDPGALGTKCLDFLTKTIFDLAGTFQQPVLFDRLDGRQRGGAGDRVAAKGRGMGAGLEFRGDFGLGDQAAASDAAGQGLGQGDDVGLDLPVLMGIPGAGAAHARLHLVEDQQQIVLVGQFAQTFQVSGGGKIDAPFSLDRFQHDRAGFRVDQARRGIEVSERCMRKTRKHGADAGVVLRLAGRAQGAHGAAMEAVEHRNDFEPARAAAKASQLDGGFVRLGAAIGEKRLGAARPARAGAECFGQLTLQFGVPGVGNVNQLADLIAHRFDDTRRAMAQDAAAPAGEKVEVFVAFVVPNRRFDSAYERHRVAGVVADHIIVKELRGVRVHSRFRLPFLFGFKISKEPACGNILVFPAEFPRIAFRS